MISHYESYKKLEKAEVEDLLNMATELSYESKLALHKVVDEKYFDEFSSLTAYRVLINSIELDKEEIEELRSLHKIGLSYETISGKPTIKRSNSSIARDITTIILGGLLMLFVYFVVKSAIAIRENGMDFLPVLMLIIQVFVTIIGLILITKGIQRLLFFRSFRIQKDVSELIIQIKTSFEVEIKRYTKDTVLMLIPQSGGNYILQCQNENEVLPLLNINSPDYKLYQTLQKVCEKMNL